MFDVSVLYLILVAPAICPNCRTKSSRIRVLIHADLDSFPWLEDPVQFHSTGDTAVQAPNWNIGLEGRAWTGSEAKQRHDSLPAQLEMIGGKLLWSEEERLVLLAALLENVGALRVVELGDPQVWRAAVARLRQP